MRVAFGSDELNLQPTKIIGLVKNYRAHAVEMGGEVPPEPRFFLKPPSALLPDGGTVILPAGSHRVDYEVELAVILSRHCRFVSIEDALDRVLGYAVTVDITARDLQGQAMKEGMPWALSKGCDTFAPLGPCIVPAQSLDPQSLPIWLKVNGQTRQSGNTRDMVFGVARLISYLSSVMTLEPHDIIATGTPEGVGPLLDGDWVEAGIDGIGVLRFEARNENREAR